MAEFPALPIWTDAYLADTRHLSTLEHGAYLLLMMEAWRRPTCSLPNDDALLSRLAGVSHNEWGSIKDTVLSLWSLDEKRNVFTQKRLTKERKFLDEKRIKNKASAASRWNKKEKEHANAMQTQCQNDAPTPTPTPTPNNKKAPSSPKKGTRIPVDFMPDISFALGLGMTQQRAISEANKFKDYWTAKSGANATKLDWPRTWNMWVRNAIDRGGGSRPQQSTFRDHQDRVTQELERAASGRTIYDDDQPSFELDRSAFRRE